MEGRFQRLEGLIETLTASTVQHFGHMAERFDALEVELGEVKRVETREDKEADVRHRYLRGLRETVEEDLEPGLENLEARVRRA